MPERTSEMPMPSRAAVRWYLTFSPSARPVALSVGSISVMHRVRVSPRRLTCSHSWPWSCRRRCACSTTRSRFTSATADLARLPSTLTSSTRLPEGACHAKSSVEERGSTRRE